MIASSVARKPRTLLPPADQAAAVAGCEDLCWWAAQKATRNSGATPADVEDVAAEVRCFLVRVAAQWYDPTAGAKFATYATGPAVHHARKYWMIQRRRGLWVPYYLQAETPVAAPRSFCGPDSEDAIDPPAPVGPGAPVEWDELWEKLRRTLTAAEWVVVERLYRRGMTEHQIASELGVTRGAVSMRKAAAFARIRSHHPELREFLS